VTNAYIIGVSRTAVVPRGGAFAQHAVYDLGACVIRSALGNSGISARNVDHVVMGNALYGGGNPTRLAALAAGLPESVPAFTIDTQCCSGLDAINLACSMVSAGTAKVVIAGGLESYSRSPLRQHRPKDKSEKPIDYARPAFTPWPQRDPDMLESASELAQQRNVTRQQQEEFAILSHGKASQASPGETEITDVAGIEQDAFTRKLSRAVCSRTAVVCGDAVTGLTPATVAVEADAAAAVVVISETMLAKLSDRVRPIKVLSHCSVGSDPSVPSIAPIAAVDRVLRLQGVSATHLRVAEVMEAFAVQAMVCIDECEFASTIVNRGGGALARGHPIGASGAVLAVRLWNELQKEACGALGLATIAAAGGLGSATLWRVT
jgi:acetyl-CoA C-acetyltransferase